MLGIQQGPEQTLSFPSQSSQSSEGDEVGKQTTYGHGGRAVTWDLRGDTSPNLPVGEGSPTPYLSFDLKSE